MAATKGNVKNAAAAAEVEAKAARKAEEDWRAAARQRLVDRREADRQRRIDERAEREAQRKQVQAMRMAVEVDPKAVPTTTMWTSNDGLVLFVLQKDANGVPKERRYRFSRAGHYTPQKVHARPR